MAASPRNPSGRIARFGLFELDLAVGELRKNGAKVRLQEQPFRILVLLLERAGDVVTREEIRQKLWPADTFVDFDHSLNAAVNKLREALGDSASSPRCIERLARRRYRFITPAQIHSRRRGSLEEASSWNLPAAQLHPELDVPIPRRWVTRGLFALAQIMDPTFCVIALFSAARDARDRRVFFVRMAIDLAGSRGDDDGGCGNPAALLSALGGVIRLPGLGRKVSADVPFHPGAGSTFGCCSILADAEDRAGGGFRGERRAA
jgi:DNA-binding winged helix-turn-helix (wHTH) protein